MARGVNVIVVVVVDRLSKYAYFITMKHLFSDKQVAIVFIDKVVKKHAMSKSIITDRDKKKIFIISGRNYLQPWALSSKEARLFILKQMDKQKE